MKFPIPPQDKFHFDYERPETAGACVALGASWLDEVAPGWERSINLSTLNVAKMTCCPCGQLFETGYEGILRIFGDDLSSFSPTLRDAVRWAADHRFAFNYKSVWG